MTELTITRSEVLANRQKVITFLLQPKRKKGKGKLDKGNGVRCCLGHMCYVLSVPRRRTDNWFEYGQLHDRNYAPAELMELIGLYSGRGALGASNDFTVPGVSATGKVNSLATWNDLTSATPQQIGTYLQSVIDGGVNTPWLPLSHYPETL